MDLKSRECLEITRFCMRRGRWYTPSLLFSWDTFNSAIARDLTYAGAYALARETGCTKAIGITDPYYLKIMARSHFVFTELYTQPTYSLVIIDLWKTASSIYRQGDKGRAERMLALYNLEALSGGDTLQKLHALPR